MSMATPDLFRPLLDELKTKRFKMPESGHAPIKHKNHMAVYSNHINRRMDRLLRCNNEQETEEGFRLDILKL